MTIAQSRYVRGRDLTELRKRSGLTQEAVAAGMGVVRSRIAHLEGQWMPTRSAVERYRAAIDAVTGEQS